MRQLPWGERLLPDELLYSLAARLAAANVLVSANAANALLFGTTSITPSIDLPSSISLGMPKISAACGLTNEDEVLERATLYPYYRYFLSEGKWTEVRRRALDETGYGLKTYLGTVAQRFGARPALQSCVRCDAESWERYGTCYWHRSHHLPGIQVCPLHGEPLVQQFPKGSRRKLLFAPARGAFASVPRAALTVAVRLALLSASILNAASRAPEADVRRRAFYCALSQRGYVRGKAKLLWEPLEAELLDWFGGFKGLAYQERLAPNRRGPLPWLRSALQVRQRSIHPYCNLLLIDWLFGQLSAFESACRFQAAKSERHAEQDYSASSIVFDTTRSCRNVAGTLRCSVHTVIALRERIGVDVGRRPKKVDATLKGKIAATLASGASVSEAAKAWDVSAATVYRILAQTPFLRHAHQQVRSAPKLATAMQTWLDVLGTTGVKSLTDARARSPCIYAWLYRNDPQWLRSTNAAFLAAANCTQ